MVERGEQAVGGVVVVAAFDAHRSLAHGRQALGRVEPGTDALGEPQTLQAGRGQDDCIEIPGVELGQAGVDVAAQRDDVQRRERGPQLGLAPQAGGADAGPGRQGLEVVIAIRDEDVARVLAFENGGQAQARRQAHGDVFQGMYGQIGASFH
jgi:hypothetical protein